MKALITGAAGFIGSHVADRLLADGNEVVGVDCFTPYYDRGRKEANLARAQDEERFQFIEADLRVRDLTPFVRDVDVVVHLAAEPGVRGSWSPHFGVYNEHNVLATQRLLDAARDASVRRFVYASSSSVYGDASSQPWDEAQLPRPHNPYGATKLGGESLCTLYGDVFDVPVITLRYFSVYGPRQRPDMAIFRLIAAGIEGTQFPIYGMGDQRRGFIHVDDAVGATIASLDADAIGQIINVGSASSISVNELVPVVSELLGAEIRVTRLAGQPGDIATSEGSFDRAHRVLGWSPTVAISDGIKDQIAWQLKERGERGGT